MAPSRLVMVTLLTSTILYGTEASPPPVPTATPAATSQQILYLAKAGEIDNALQRFTESFKISRQADFNVLQQLALATIHQGFLSGKAEDKILSLFGAGIAIHEGAFDILEAAMMSRDPNLNMMALHLLAQQQDDRTDALLMQGLSSNYVALRLEAAYILAVKKHANAVGQMESLMYKLDPRLKPLFPRLFAIHGSAEALAVLRRQLNDKDTRVRVQAILSASALHHDTFLSYIRTLADEFHPLQQEACASALGQLNDGGSVERLRRIARSQSLTVRLAACQALYRLGDTTVVRDVEAIARGGNLFGIAILGEMSGSEDTLAALLNHEDLSVRANASIALVERHDPRGLEILKGFLIRGPQDWGLAQTLSPSGALTAWKAIPSIQAQAKDDPCLLEMSTRAKEYLIQKAAELKESDFLRLAGDLFRAEQNELVPALVAALGTLNTPTAVELLKGYEQCVGAPFIRGYCNLTLYKLKEPGPYAANLRKWVAEQKDVDMIRFRPLVPLDRRHDATGYQLTPQETSRLLVESFEALATTRDTDSLLVLLDTIQKGNARNRYALAGLLLRATQ